jgi:hypothetical protein
MGVVRWVLGSVGVGAGIFIAGDRLWNRRRPSPGEERYPVVPVARIVIGAPRCNIGV